MAMKKAEMESHAAEYRVLMCTARSALQERRYREALDLALSSWEHIDGMMQFERKRTRKEPTTVEGIDIVLKHAPLLLDFQSLDKLDALLKSQRRIERNTSHNMAEKLVKARGLIWDAHAMWDHLERHPGAREDQLRQALGGDQLQWRSVAEAWERMGLVSRTPDAGSRRLSLSTQMTEAVLAKCPSCGVVARGAKARFLGELTCPKCRATVLFVILSRRPGTDAKE